MHRDKKVGLALGILLIGVVGALFFRHERQTEPGVSEFRETDELDEQIAEQPHRPYLAEDEVKAAGDPRPTGSGASNTDAGPQNETRGSLQNPSDAPVPEIEETAWADVPRTSSVPPDPITLRPDRSSAFAEDPVPIPDHNRAWDAVETGENAPVPKPVRVERGRLPTAETKLPAEESPVAESGEEQPLQPAATEQPTERKRSTAENQARTYEVQSGDTLSGLAARFLGSARHYRRLYRANRSLLEDPNDLRAGMVLQIPPEPQAGETAQHDDHEAVDEPRDADAGTSRSPDDRPASAGNRAEIPRRFVPVRKSPFLPGLNDDRREDDSTGPNAAAKERRRLSQRPPERFRQVSQPSRPETYTVQPGDSLLKIALRFYGSRSAVHKLYEANRDRLSDPDRLPAGITVTLP